MSSEAQFHEPHGNRAVQTALVLVGVLLAAALLWYLYTAFTSVGGVKVEAPPPQVVNMLPPPPPPPPPPPEPQQKPPEPTEAPTPTPQPAKAPDAPAPMQMNAEAQAGTGGIAAGTGGGMGAPSSTGTCVGLNCGKPAGGGINDGLYRQYLSSALQQAVYRDSRSRRFASSAEFSILVSPAGMIERVELRASSGKAEDDAVLRDILAAVRGLRAPPYTQRYPVLIRVRGRKSL